jgi:glutamyl/glutaminyl-tRNA synthetase
LLYEALGLSTPVFAHLSTILGADGTKLSKRHGATSIDEFRRQGYLPEALDNYLALLGWAPSQDGQEILDLAELVREFDLDRVNRSPAVFDSEKLNWVNRSHLRRASRDRLAELALPYLQSSGLLAASPSPEEASWATDLTELLLNHVNRLDDLGTEARRALAFDPDVDLHSPDVLEILAHPGARSVIQALAECLDDSVPVDGTVYREIASLVKQKTGQKGKHLFHPIRVAVTGRASGPDLERLIPLLERGQRLPLPAPVLGVKGRVSAVLERLR